MTNQPPFLLDLHSTNGTPVSSVDDGDGAELTVYEWTSWLRIRSDVTGFVPPSISPDDDEMTGFVPPVFEDDGIGVLLHLRDHQDLTEQAVGLYFARLEHNQLEAVRAAVAALDWAKLPRPVGGDISAPKLSLRYASGNLLIQRAFNARSSNFIEAIAPLWRLLDELMTRTMRGPAGTLEAKLDLKQDESNPRQCRLRLILRNRGIGPVALTDPRVPTPSGPPRLEIKIGERTVDRDSLGPFEWTTFELPPLPESAPRTLMLSARDLWDIELPWLAPKPGRYEVQARWLDYAGPLDALPGQTPFMPVPSKGRSFVGSGPYPVRGSCQAALRFEIPEPSPPTR